MHEGQSSSVLTRTVQEAHRQSKNGVINSSESQLSPPARGFRLKPFLGRWARSSTGVGFVETLALSFNGI